MVHVAVVAGIAVSLAMGRAVAPALVVRREHRHATFHD